MILDSRSDIENWFLDAFYKLKNQDTDMTQDISVQLKYFIHVGHHLNQKIKV